MSKQFPQMNIKDITDENDIKNLLQQVTQQLHEIQSQKATKEFILKELDSMLNELMTFHQVIKEHQWDEDDAVKKKLSLLYILLKIQLGFIKLP